ncbi:OsmC family protein [Bacillaceae bacterium IKA-2]|nr:OsmC family protein [Bacillaceae bacterium IKA-2]
MKTTIDWTGKMAFTGTTPSGHQIMMDAPPEVGGENKAPRPTELLLNAVAGCTGIDIISILTKMRAIPTSFTMEVEAERAEDHPKKVTKLHIHYVFEGDLPEDKVVRAIKLSKDTYCSVSHSLSAEITVSYSINGNRGEEII